jgi:uncharacterized protein (DUF934 family)
MPLVKGNTLIEDSWVSIPDDAEINGDLGEAQAIIVSLTRWRDERAALALRSGPVGVQFEPDESVHDLVDDASGVNKLPDLVALNFPAFKDGRGFSQARLLRDRLGFEGEIRATGNVIPDQAIFLDRCGVDTVHLPDDVAVERWLAERTSVEIYYQPATRGEAKLPA